MGYLGGRIGDFLEGMPANVSPDTGNGRLGPLEPAEHSRVAGDAMSFLPRRPRASPRRPLGARFISPITTSSNVTSAALLYPRDQTHVSHRALARCGRPSGCERGESV